MWFLDISVVKEGTDTQAVEALLLETFERYEVTEVRVVEKALRAIMHQSHHLLRYRVYTKPDIVGFSYLISQLRGRLEARTKSEVRMTHPQSVTAFGVDRKMAFD